uniref:Gypsy retrotransposon integrase-like protein 1 n=1 Tax=Kryptolebias marmoratus TaxID=37003 RepID=A0A3Q3B5M5_KRYMA
MAFRELKRLFSSAPVLCHPDPGKQFLVEVDASDTGVGAVLSQRSSSDSKVHPCAFFSRRLSPSERNYDVGNRELLAIKLALEEWRHWLEGSREPFVIWTDHKNLTYLQNAKRLNPRQARWSLFFARFNFILTYRPGTKNIKADALSRQFSATDSPKSEVNVLPESCFVGSLTWEIENTIAVAQRTEPDPGTGPRGRRFVPESVVGKVLDWVHNHRFTCHPGITRMTTFAQRHFWWPTMTADIKEYVSACQTCARNKSLHQPPSGLLQPLPVPARPWSHISLDFVTGLPPSEGNTVILNIVDRFSKSAHFIPLTKLPSALETAQLLVHHVFRLHGIPQDVVSDRGPQFVSQVWKAFCNALGAQVSLSSCYHPQSNGQTERCNQELEAALRCVINNNPSSWCKHLPLIEYANNGHTSAATGFSPFESSLGYNPPLFPDQETEILVPSVQAHIKRCQRIWRQTRAALLRTA